MTSRAQDGNDLAMADVPRPDINDEEKTIGTAAAKATVAPVSASSSSRPTPARRSRSSWKKPKRSMTAYNFFFAEERVRILAEQEAAAAAAASEASSTPEQKEASALDGADNKGATLCPSCTGRITPSLTAFSQSESSARYVSSSSSDEDDNDASSSAASSSSVACDNNKICRCPSSISTVSSTAIAEATTNLSVRKGKKKPHGMISFQQLNTEISRRWKLVKPKDLARYKGMAKKDVLRYKEEMKAYHEQQVAAMALLKQNLSATATPATSAGAGTASTNGRTAPVDHGIGLQSNTPTGEGVGSTDPSDPASLLPLQLQLLLQQAHVQGQQTGLSPSSNPTLPTRSPAMPPSLQPLPASGQAPAPAPANLLASLLGGTLLAQQPLRPPPQVSPGPSNGNNDANVIISLLLQQLLNAKEQPQPSTSAFNSPLEQRLLQTLLRQNLQAQISQLVQGDSTVPTTTQVPSQLASMLQAAMAAAPVSVTASAPAPLSTILAGKVGQTGAALFLPASPPGTALPAAAATLLAQAQSIAPNSTNASPAVAAPLSATGNLLTPGSSTANALAMFRLQRWMQQQQSTNQLQAPSGALSSLELSPLSSVIRNVAPPPAVGGSQQFMTSNSYIQHVLDAVSKAGNGGSISSAATSTGSASESSSQQGSSESDASAKVSENSESNRRIKKRKKDACRQEGPDKRAKKR